MVHLIAVSYRSEVHISRKYHHTSFCIEKGAASVLSNKRS